MQLKQALIVLVVLFSVAIALSEHEAQQEFTNFLAKYNKKYEPHELVQRYINFKASLERVEKRNAKSKYAQFGITKFSDMSVEEFKSTILMKNKITPSKHFTKSPVDTANAPQYLDWRAKGAVTPVKDQEQCGSCWAFSATEEIESMWILAGKGTNTTVDLAPQQIVDCDWGSLGCNGGQPVTAYEYVRVAGGLEPENDYPYTGEDGSCQSNSADYVASITSWAWASGLENEQDLLNNLIAEGPLSICVYAESWMDYVSGVMSEDDCENSFFTLDHCVQLVGFDTIGAIYPDTNVSYYIVRNSWNTDWGLAGYILLQMGQDTCGIADEASYVII